jgi:transposase
VHRKAVRLLLEQPVHWLQVEWLPSYAPELNPVEHLWNHTKWGDLANFVPHDRDHLRRAASQSLHDQRDDPARLSSCFLAAKLV